MINKVFKSLKNDGIIATLKKVGRYVKYRFFVKQKKNLIKEVIDVNKFENVIIFENNFGWNKIMKQRPQQIANGLPDNTLMFYHSHEAIDYKKNKVRINKLKDNLILVDLGYFRDMVLEELAAHNSKYLMIYSTDYIPYDRIKLYQEYGYEILYEYVDDFNVDLNGKDAYKILTERHKMLIKDDPFVICTATELYNKCIESKFKYVKLITNGVDYDHFKASNVSVPQDLVKIKEKYKYLICYYGALASWYDYELTKKLADNPDYAVVLLGQDYDQTLTKSGILDCDNIFYLGKKDYSELPAYGNNCDVCIIPFVINDITRSTSPVKIFEYMAMQKPIVTTALPECKKYESVLYSNSHQEFIGNVEKAIKLRNDKKYQELLTKEAKENTWKSKSQELIEFASSSRYSKLTLEIKDILSKEKYERIIIWRSPFGWNVPLFQRPQHIARQLARKNCLVLYEITKKTDNVNTIKEQEKNLYLVNFENYFVNSIIREELENIKKPKYVQFYSTNWSMSIDELKEYIANDIQVLYEYIDDISPDLAGTDEIPPYIIDKYNYAMENKDILVVTTAKALYDDVKQKRGDKHLILSCNGVDYEFYQKLDEHFKFDKHFTNIINNGKINLCYYGALATWFDYELIRKIDAENKFNIILFGVKYDDSFDESRIEKLPNVHFLGSKDYSILKNYASKMDILTIPFVINSITQATSPLKLFEYMALHKPIVTSAMNECKNYQSVLTADNHEEFIQKLYECEKLAKDKKYLDLLDKEAKENDWGHKAELIIDMLKDNEGGKHGKN